ncbi:MAG: Dipeptidyl carboxypeptidase [uncultured Chthoniobacterales bacterium]|uniref:Dipeptidyl carboxypeptidase n=1 Tax=uncultured Chthoniobacterales bacterium TaxID=1836801 RepID=A0A6J4J2U0_9BACT|nr:MAG: Dipeptidyl carboxypeptidase [uncultured Chthoniobacterales bacterium]
MLRSSLLCATSLFVACSAFAAASAIQERADRFLALANAGYKGLVTVNQEAQWAAVTDVKPEHDAAAAAAGKAAAAFNGNPALINEAKELLKHRKDLTEITVRQLDQLLRNAAEGPMTNPPLVTARVEAETKQSSTLNGFEFKLGGQPISANDIDTKLDTSTDLDERRRVWEASKESGVALKEGLLKLRDLRNGVAKELGHKDYFALQVAGYGMTTDEMVKLHDEFLRELRPLYLQLHTWTKHKLAEKYKQPVPKRIPAHWINNRWSQEWTGLVEAANIDDRFKGRDPEWITKTAEQFYTGLGFSPLPASFWTKSDLYPIKPGEQRKKNTHASCWHINLEDDIRSLMSIESNSRWFYTAHHELGHGYYDMSYTRPEVPPLLRTGANPSFHEGMGELISLASSQVPYLQSRGVLPNDFKADATAFLLDDALSRSLPFMFWGSGTMTHWEADFYAKGLPADQLNARWWQYVRDHQGVEPPAPRGEEFCDAATKTHINDTPAYYYSYAIATVLKFQLHDHIARKILKQPPQACNYADNKEVGAFLRKIMEKGATEDWRKVLKDATGEELSTRAMMEYFKPLMAWLEKENTGRQIGWD